MIHYNKFLDNTKYTNLINDNIDNKYIDISNECPLINLLKEKYGSIDTYDKFVNCVNELFGSFTYYTSKDENKKYILINKNINSNDAIKNFTSTVYQKSPFKKVCSFVTPIFYNNNALVELKNISVNFDNLIIKQATENYDIILLYDDTWNIITEKSLYGKDILIKNKSVSDLFNETIKDKNIDLNNLDKDKIYHLKMTHHKNDGLIFYNHYGSGYKELFINFIQDKNKLYLCPLIQNIKHINHYKFNTLCGFIDHLNNITHDNMTNKKISIEGYDIYLYNNDTNELNMYKIQTQIYQQITHIKPKYNNTNIGYLEMYQENKLKEYLPYLTNYHSEIIHRISMSIRTISKEILDIYHFLKKQKRSELYTHIPLNYKKILYNIHGIYIDSRKNDFLNNTQDKIENNTKSITVHDIYHYLKSLPITTLKQIYFDREMMIKEKKIDDNLYKLLIHNCIYTIVQTKLMSI